MRRAALAGGALALMLAQPAQAACIDGPTASAARLHEFETMMMAVSLRCSRVGVAMRADYDGLVTAYRTHFEGAAARLQAFFGSLDGKRKGEGYDRYSTLLANKYGGGQTSLDTCHLLEGVTTEIVKAHDGGRVLLAVAGAMIARSTLEVATCPAVASARP
ncbi:MAG: hypothetical protein RIS94_652 [Pseudomonadota bacterium]|jgi:hypothetical protein